ncbi:efflux RND transporter periplasmic adaptor subunit [Anatilimnocola floriformis]|uniref:efflux RND transporter periplasmic adaptor subunit n=1 Tax=Anatilimnocola floriformis TaxID=2948575 RepID=UPI0020C5AE8C|nr:efflux RND transporter periplasmic adaptor subunit [Anatilimnocola floriformis]
MAISFSPPVRNAALGIGALLLAGIGWKFLSPQHSAADKAAEHQGPTATPVSHESAVKIVDFSPAARAAAGVRVQPVDIGPFRQVISLTGKLALNEDRLSHVYPLVEGRVEEVKVQFGQRVQANDVLVVVQSKEVGQAKLQLFQDRLQHELALAKNKWTQESSANALAMLELIRTGATLETIEARLRDRPLGDYREKLMSAFLEHYRAKLHLERLSPLSKDGAIAGKQLLEAEATHNVTRAAMQSIIEQLAQDARQTAAASEQMVKDLQTRVAVDETTLLVMGFEKSELAEVNPAKLGESISHYTIRAPFAGTVIAKDVTPLERIGPTSQILSIADLSTVWVTADIFEEHLPRLKSLEGKNIQLRTSSWPGQSFAATVFYTGDIIQEASRTVSLRARAENKDGKLKPGMFVNIEIEDIATEEVLSVPLAAVQEHEGKSFVFVQIDAEHFERRDVQTGRRNDQSVELVAGLKAKDEIATAGCFALKSQMLAELLAE